MIKPEQLMLARMACSVQQASGQEKLEFIKQQTGNLSTPFPTQKNGLKTSSFLLIASIWPSEVMTTTFTSMTPPNSSILTSVSTVPPSSHTSIGAKTLNSSGQTMAHMNCFTTKLKRERSLITSTARCKNSRRSNGKHRLAFFLGRAKESGKQAWMAQISTVVMSQVSSIQMGISCLLLEMTLEM